MKKIKEEVIEWYWRKQGMESFTSNSLVIEANMKSDLGLAIDLTIQKTAKEIFKDLDKLGNLVALAKLNKENIVDLRRLVVYNKLKKKYGVKE